MTSHELPDEGGGVFVMLALECRVVQFGLSLGDEESSGTMFHCKASRRM